MIWLLGLCWRKPVCSTISNARLGMTYCSTIQSGKMKVGGVELFYQTTGGGDQAVLLIPGALGSGQTDFTPQMKGLCRERFTLVSFDPRGYGHSRPPQRDYPHDFFQRDAKDALGLMKELKFEKFCLLGWSDGGIVAMIAAALQPARVNKLVVWGANAYVSQQDVEIYNGVKDVSQWSERMRKPMVDMYGMEYFAQTWEAWVDGISHFAQRPDGSICCDLLPLIQCPTLVIHGEKDPMVPNFHPQYLHKHIAGSRLHLMPEGKHNLHLKFAAEFNKLVEQFLCE